MISFLTAAMPRSQSSALIYAAAVEQPAFTARGSQLGGHGWKQAHLHAGFY